MLDVWHISSYFMDNNTTTNLSHTAWKVKFKVMLLLEWREYVDLVIGLPVTLKT